MKQSRLITIAFTVLILSALFAKIAFSDCPPLIDTPKEFRIHLRDVVLSYLSDPSNSDYIKQDILDLIAFYSSRNDFQEINDCEAKMDDTHPRVIDILLISIIFKTECNDATDNDGDGKTDMQDLGCIEPVDNDETNCGDGICEDYETQFSCDLDCGVYPSTSILTMKSLESTAIAFREDGNVALKGNILANANPAPSLDSEFIIKDASGSITAIIDLIIGDMQLKGNLFQSQSSLVPPPESFIIKNSGGNIIGYIDSLGNFYIKGILTENDNAQ